MKVQHISLGLFATILWGLNFVISKIALSHIPPFLFTALRFAILVPLLLFIPKPKVPMRLIVGLGLTWGVLQFTCMHVGLVLGMPAGVSSLVMQTSSFFGVFFAWMFLHERVTLLNLAGLLVGFAGIVVLGWDGNASAPLSGLLLTLFASAAWSFGNILLKKMKDEKNNAGIIVWSRRQSDIFASEDGEPA